MKKSRLIGALCASFCLMNGFVTSVHAIGVTGQGTWETTLQARDLDSNLTTAEAYYDTVLGITWLADANYAGTAMDWSTADAWAASLDPYSSGITGWRLPTVTDTGSSGCDFAFTGTDCGYNVDTATSEMAHMFHTTLGDKSYYDTSGNGPQSGWSQTPNPGPFSNVQSDRYWSATENAPDLTRAWIFGFADGFQNDDPKVASFYGWAVHAGDVGAAIVPLPAALWLFGFGLLGLMGVGRCRR